MASAPSSPETLDQLESLLERWQTSLDLHAKYAALDEDRYWHVQPWPRHERPQRWIIQLARKRILALKRVVAQRQAEGDRAFIEGIEIMSFLAGLVGLTSVERFIPLATHETERRDVLAAKPAQKSGEQSAAKPADKPPAREREPAARSGEHRRSAETTRQMPQLPASKLQRAPAAPKRDSARPASPRPASPRPATIKPKKATLTQTEHVVIADAVRLLGWGKQWHEIGDMIGRLAERPAPSEIRRILRTYREHIDAIVSRRGA
jgi:hypothetical protein